MLSLVTMIQQNLVNNLVREKFLKIVNLQDIIKKDNLNYKSKCGKTYNFGKYSSPIAF